MDCMLSSMLNSYKDNKNWKKISHVSIERAGNMGNSFVTLFFSFFQNEYK